MVGQVGFLKVQLAKGKQPRYYW